MMIFMISFLDAIWREIMETNKLYAYRCQDSYFDWVKYLSFDKELLQELIMDDYFEEAFNYFCLNCWEEPKNFWKHEKENSYLTKRYIIEEKKYVK